MKVFSNPRASEPITFQSLVACSLLTAALVYGPAIGMALISAFKHNFNLVRPESIGLITALWMVVSPLLWCWFSLEIKDKRKNEASFEKICSEPNSVQDTFLVDTVGGKTVLVVKTKDGNTHRFFEGMVAIEKFKHLKSLCSDKSLNA